MKPALKMMAMERIRQPEKPPSEYGGKNNRRMIGFDREESKPTYNSPQRGGESPRYESPRYESPRGGDYPPMNAGRYEPQGGVWPGWERPPMGRERDMPPMGREREMPPMGRYDEPESRRRRDSRGRFATASPDYDEDDEDDYRHKRRERKGELIASGSVWMNPGKSSGEYSPVTERQAMEWVHSMEQPPGGRPMPAFRIEETEALRKAHCPECEQWEFFTVMNMKYSDCLEVAKKFNVDKPEFYALMAKAFLTDKDAGQYKLQKYMEMIPKG